MIKFPEGRQSINGTCTAVLTQITRSDFCTVSMSVRQVMQRDRRHSSFRSWRNNETCHVNLTCYMLKHVMRHFLLFSSLIATWLEKKKKDSPQSKAIKSRAMLIQSNNPLEFTQVEVSNHYLTFQN